MTPDYEIFEKRFQGFFQTEVIFYVYQQIPKTETRDAYVKQTILKKGILLNLTVKPPFLFFKMFIKDKIRDDSFPIPFKHDMPVGKNLYMFDYRLESLVDDKNIVDFLKNLPHNNDSKLFDTVLYIESLHKSKS